MLSADINKKLIRRIFEEGLNEGLLDVVDELFSEDFVDHSTPEQEPGAAGVRAYFTMVRTGFPDMQVAIDDLIAEGEKVVARTTWRGTHQGTYYGHPATNQQVARTMIQIFRIVGSSLGNRLRLAANSR